MSSLSLPLPQTRRPANPEALAWMGAAAGTALALGLAATMQTKLALMLAVGIGLLVQMTRRPTSILPILAISIFLELIKVGSLTISRALAPIALFALLIQLLRRDAAVRGAPQLRWAIAYALWAVASGLWTLSTAGTNYELQSLAIAGVYMLCFAALPRSENDLKAALPWLGYASLVVGSLSILSFFNKIHLSLFTAAGRSSGGVGDPDFFSAVELAVLPVVLVLSTVVQGTRRRATLIFSSLVIMGGVLTSQSRGGAIALVVDLVLLLLLPSTFLFRTRREKVVRLLCVLAAGVALLIHSPWAVLPRLHTILGNPQNGNAAGSGREEIWKAARHSISDHPLFGTGYGSFVYRSDNLMLNTPGVDLTFFYLRTPGSEAHDLYLGTWADLGIPGLVLYLGMMAATAQSLRRTAKRAAAAGSDFVRRLANGLLLGLLSWSLTSIFLSTDTARMFWIIMGLSLALPRLLPDRAAAPAKA